MTRMSDSSGETEPKDPQFTDPLGAAFQNIFGVPLRYSSSDKSYFIAGAPGTTPLDNGTNSYFADRIFGPSNFNSLADQLDPVAQSDFARMATQGLSSADSSFSHAINLFQNELTPAAQRIAADGSPTSIDPIIANAQRMFSQQTVPELANQFGFLGGGGQNRLSGDFGESVARAGGDMASQLGTLQYDATEQAKQRQLQALTLSGQLGQVAPEFAQLQAALPAAVGSDILGLNEQNFDQQLLFRPGGQFMNMLSNMMNIIQTEPILSGSTGTQGSSTLGIIG